MKTLQAIEAQIESWEPDVENAETQAAELLTLAETILENWLVAHERNPKDEVREGFYLLSLHRQSAKGDPSFNACRETCRELAFRFNLIKTDSEAAETEQRLVMMRRLAHHLVLFVSGKLQVAELGEFCCASRPLRQTAETPR